MATRQELLKPDLDFDPLLGPGNVDRYRRQFGSRDNPHVIGRYEIIKRVHVKEFVFQPVPGSTVRSGFDADDPMDRFII